MRLLFINKCLNNKNNYDTIYSGGVCGFHYKSDYPYPQFYVFDSSGTKYNKGDSYMRVADIYCGAGGFSEGFRQAGFDIVFAIDKWEPAVNTFKANKPNSVVVQDDVIRISKLPDDEFHSLIPDTEVIIGSPPCVAFSNSNKSGNGDKSLGIDLLKAFFRIIARKKYKKDSILRYWVLENVPNIEKYIQEKYLPSDLDIEGDFCFIPINQASGVYNAKYYGAPTNRKRFLCGEFPEPLKTNNDDNIISFKTVLNSLGEPCEGNNDNIIDSNYQNLQLPRNNLTDHHYLYMLQPFEWESAKRLKEDRGYMGKMSFPENLNKPARTVMATMSTSSRESMIISAENGGYRLPTVREAATLMSFPIDYRFYGNSKGTKHTLVGNSVPPKMSYAIARAILFDANEILPDEYIPINHNPNIDFYNLNGVIFPEKQEKRKRDTAKFKYHIPYFIINSYRIELTNYHSDFKNKIFKWDVEIHYSQGKKKARVFNPAINKRYIEKKLLTRCNEFVKHIKPMISKTYNDFQKIYCMTTRERLQKKLIGPYEILNLVKEFLNNNKESLSDEHLQVNDSDLNIPESIYLGYYLLSKLLLSMR